MPGLWFHPSLFQESKNRKNIRSSRFCPRREKIFRTERTNHRLIRFFIDM